MSINVLYVTNQCQFHGGAPRSLYEILSHLDRTKVSPFVAYTAEGELISRIQNMGVPTVKLWPFRKNNPTPLLLSTAKLVQFILQHNIDLIHNNQCCDAYNSWLAGKLTRTPIIIHHRDPSLYRLDWFLIHHVECNIAISSWYHREILQGQGIVVLNGIDIDQFPPINHRPLHHVIKVGVVGRLDPKKGQHVFIEAVREIHSMESKVRVVFQIIGDWDSSHYQDYKKTLYELRKRYGLEKVVQFRKWQNDSAGIYRELDICVVPSIREPFGRVVIESLACATPVIATNIGGALDVVTEECGILVPVNDHLQLAKAIMYLAERPELRHQMGKAGRARVERHFTIHNTLDTLYQVYSQLVDAKRDTSAIIALV